MAEIIAIVHLQNMLRKVCTLGDVWTAFDKPLDSLGEV
jgi:hypothetical protein